MSEVTTIGLDIAKHVFHAHGADAARRAVVSRTLALLMLPDYVMGACADVEALNPYFAERTIPRVGDPA